MNEYEIIGLTLVVGIPVLAAGLKILKTWFVDPIVLLRTSIVELTAEMRENRHDIKRHDEKINEHDEKLADHDKRICLLEYKDGEKHD